MHSEAYEMAKKYYPKFWDIDRLRTLVEKDKLTPAEFEEITGQPYGSSVVGRLV